MTTNAPQTQSHPHKQHSKKETAMKRTLITMVAMMATLLTTLAPQIAWGAVDPGMVDKVKGNSNYTSFYSAVKPCKPDGTCPSQDAVDEAESTRSGLLRAIRSTVGASSSQEYIGPVLGSWAGVTFKVGSSAPPTDKWCASASKKIPLADPCPPCPDGTKEVKGKCIADPKPIPPPVQDKICEGSGRKVKPSEPCPVWGIWSQDWIATAETCPADTHEVKADKPACGCDSDELTLIKKPNDGTQCPMKLWVKVLIGIGILLLVLLGLLLIGYLSRKKDDKVNCPKDPLHPKGVPGSKCQCGEIYPTPAKPAVTVKCLGKPPHDNVAGAAKCITCGAEVPPPPTASKPDEKGGSSLNLEELDQRIAQAVDRDRAAERAQADAMLCDSLLSSSSEHLEELKAKAEVATDPAEKAAMALSIRSIELLQEHWGMIRKDLVTAAQAAIDDKNKK